MDEVRLRYRFQEMASQWFLVDGTSVCVPCGARWGWKEMLWLEFASWGTSCDLSARDPARRDPPAERCGIQGRDVYVVLSVATAWEVLVSAALMPVPKYGHELGYKT